MRANLHSLEPLAPLMPADSRHVIEQAEIMLDASGPRAFPALRRGGFVGTLRATGHPCPCEQAQDRSPRKPREDRVGLSILLERIH